MKVAILKLKSTTPYSQSKHVCVPSREKEGKDAYEKRTWRERLHYDPDNLEVFIPPMQFCNCFKEAAKYLNIQISGKGKTTYTKHFESGLMVTEPLKLGIKRDDVPGETVYVPSDGRRGGTTRVFKTFPLISHWEGKVKFYILDDIITKDIFLYVAETAANLIGIGHFRPRNWGYYGRFEVVDIEWIEQ